MTAHHGHVGKVASQWSADQAGQAPGLVKIRLSGAVDDIQVIAQLLGGIVIERSAPYQHRRDPGVRVYLTAVVRNTSRAGQLAPGPASDD
jgi:hypothetical protein